MKRSAILSAAGVVALGLAASASTPNPRLMAPRIIMFYGGVLDEGRRYLTDQDTIWGFVRAISHSTADTQGGLGDRPYVDVGLYWDDPTWEPYVADTTLLGTLPLPLPSARFAPWFPPSPPVRPEDRARLVQPARLYLGSGDASPLFDFLSRPSPVHLPSAENRTCVPCAGGPSVSIVAGPHSIEPDGIAILRGLGVPAHSNGVRGYGEPPFRTRQKLMDVRE
jgi:hypothetical protein